MTSHTAGQLAELVQAEVVGDAALEIVDGQSLDDAGPADLSFVAAERNLRQLADSQAGAIVVPRKLYAANQHRGSLTAGRTLLVVPDALMAFLEILQVLRKTPAVRETGISHSAHVHPSVEVGEGTAIHPGAHLAADVQVGRNCSIHPNVVIQRGCQLGDNVTLHPGVVLYAGCSLGSNVCIHANSVIGSDGFGYRAIEGRHRKLPHFGTVRIEDDVEIGSCVAIDRAMIGETVIGTGTRLDNFVHIAHNCNIGRHSLIMAGAAFAGSVTTGEYLTCAGQVGVADHVEIGDRVTIGAQSGVSGYLPDDYVCIGTPANPASETRRIWRTMRKLPEIWKTIRDLHKRVASLESEDQRSATAPGVVGGPATHSGFPGASQDTTGPSPSTASSPAA